MSRNSGDGFFAMIERLYRTFVALYWIAILVLLPILAVQGLLTASRRKRDAKDKYERRYWNNELVLNGCLLYGVVAIYYHVLQDLIFFPFGSQVQADFTEFFESIMGLPAAIWYVYTDRATALSNDPLTFFIPTFIGVLVLFVISFALYCFRTFGYEDVDGCWVPSARRCREIREKIDREEAPFRAATARLSEHKMKHPSNHPAWNELTDEQRGILIEKWELERTELERAKDACPRAAAFTTPVIRR